jgi:hypothetical protein
LSPETFQFQYNIIKYFQNFLTLYALFLLFPKSGTDYIGLPPLQVAFPFLLSAFSRLVKHFPIACNPESGSFSLLSGFWFGRLEGMGGQSSG